MPQNKKQLIGPAEEEIRTLLSQSGDPLEAIRVIQKDYGLDLPGIDDMYPLLDLCNCSRLDVHNACLSALNKAIVNHIEQPDFQLENFYDLFEKTFSYIHIPLMQPIPMALLRKFEKHIGEDVIEKLKSNMTVFDNCPMNIKQRVWKQDESFFQQTMISLLNDYHHDESLQTLALNLKPDSYQEVIEERRTHPIVLRVMSTIGDDPQIYRMFIDMIRVVFEATPYSSLCSLRVDVLMNFHDMECLQVLDVDRCHQLIWSLDSCVRNQNMDETIIEKIKECFDNVRNGSYLYAEFAMVLMDPLISNFLASTIVKWLRNNVENNLQLENLEELTNYNAKLLNLAENAPKTVANNTKVPKLDKDLKENYWNAICKIMLEEGHDRSYPMSDKIANIMMPLLRRTDIARKVFVHYLVERTFEGDMGTLSRCLPLLLQTWPTPGANEEEEGVVYRQTYLSFVKTMLDIIIKRYLVHCVAEAQWRQVIMDGFLLQVVAWESRIHEQMVRFLIEYFMDPKVLIKLGPQVGLLVEWADIMVTHGAKDEKSAKSLKELYTYLLSRSNSVLNGEFRIAPAAVIQFCTL
ncbi:cofactor of BRCA1-domain-containing protein [Blakeslea trispora]|nr:cofactor of BRCA1-domain-containing protein [Blakeslea trispora]